MNDSYDHLLYNIIVDKWNENAEIELSTICIGRSFLNHHLKYKDTYLKYTLHKRFYTNEKLHKMGIKESNLCGMFRLEVDSVEHMLLFGEHSKKLGNEVGDWIPELGMNDYNLTERKIIVGDLEKALAINSIILYTK